MMLQNRFQPNIHDRDAVLASLDSRFDVVASEARPVQFKRTPIAPAVAFVSDWRRSLERSSQVLMKAAPKPKTMSAPAKRVPQPAAWGKPCVAPNCGKRVRHDRATGLCRSCYTSHRAKFCKECKKRLRWYVKGEFCREHMPQKGRLNCTVCGVLCGENNRTGLCRTHTPNKAGRPRKVAA